MSSTTLQRPANDELASPKPTSQSAIWQLYGTLGCHLCDLAENLLYQAQTVRDFDWQTIDIADLPEAQMLDFAQKIPVLVTPTTTLIYPFSIMDILAIAD